MQRPTEILRRLIPPSLLTAILTLLVTAGAMAEPTVLFLGDSLTEGYGVPKHTAFPSLIDKALDKKGMKDVKIINAGISGSTTASAVRRLRWHLRSKDKASIVVLALGANDGLRGQSIENAKKNLGETIDLAHRNGMKVLLAGMMIPPNYGQDYASKFAAMFKELAQEKKVPLIPFLLEGVGGEPELNLPDGIHPNEKGHAIVAKTVLQYLEPMLKK